MSGWTALVLAGLSVLQPDYRARLEEAFRLAGSDRLEQALVLAETLVAEEPAIAQGYLLLGELYRTSWRPLDAVDTFTRGLDEAPEAAAELHRQIAVTYAELRAWDEALSHAERSLEVDPEHAPSRYTRAMVLVQKGDRQKALAEYESLLELEPDNAALHFRLGEIHESVNRLDPAEASFRRALELDARHQGARFRLGKLLAARGESPEAERHLAAAVRLAPEHAESHLELAQVMESNGRDAKARYHYERAIELDPWLKNAYLAYGNFTQRQENGEGGEALLSKFQELSRLETRTSDLIGGVDFAPEDFSAKERLVDFLIDASQFPLAVRMSQGFLVGAESDVRLHLLLARAYRAWGRDDEAERVRRRAAARFPDSDAIRDELRGRTP